MILVSALFAVITKAPPSAKVYRALTVGKSGGLVNEMVTSQEPVISLACLDSCRPSENTDCARSKTMNALGMFMICSDYGEDLVPTVRTGRTSTRRTTRPEAPTRFGFALDIPPQGPQARPTLTRTERQ